MHYDYDMWSVLRAAVTKHHKLDWLKTTELYSNYFGGLASNISIDRLKSKGGQGRDSSRGSRGEAFLLLPASGGQLAFSASAASLSS